jgi:hypothetical protein
MNQGVGSLSNSGECRLHVELEDAVFAWASEVNNTLRARGEALSLPEIVEDDDDVGGNNRDSVLTTTTTLGVVSRATPQRVISLG